MRQFQLCSDICKCLITIDGVRRSEFKKILADLTKVVISNTYDLIYFDTFSPAIQPEMWTVEIFQKMYNSLNTGGVLVTYCCKGTVKRAMKEAGFHIEILPGPPGKRHMLRAEKLI